MAEHCEVLAVMLFVAVFGDEQVGGGKPRRKRPNLGAEHPALSIPGVGKRHSHPRTALGPIRPIQMNDVHSRQQIDPVIFQMPCGYCGSSQGCTCFVVRDPSLEFRAWLERHTAQNKQWASWKSPHLFVPRLRKLAVGRVHSFRRCGGSLHNTSRLPNKHYIAKPPSLARLIRASRRFTHYQARSRILCPL